MVQLLNSIYLGAAKPEDYGKAAGVVELLPFDYYLGAAVPSHGKPTINVLLSGVSPLTLLNAVKLNYVKAFGKCEQDLTPTPASPVDIVCNNGVIKVRHQSGLPLRYHLLTYLRASSGIDVGIKTTKNTEIEAAWTWVASSAQYLYLSDSSSSGSSNTTAYISTSGNWRFGNRTGSFSPTRDFRNVSVQNAKGVVVNGEQVISYGSIPNFTSVSNLKLFGSGASVRAEYIKVRESGVLVRDLLPVYDTVDNIYGFYDLVGETFYTNANAQFTAGGYADDPIEVYTDGTVETVTTKQAFVNDSDVVDKSGLISSNGATIANNSRCYVLFPCKAGVTYTAQTDTADLIGGNFIEYNQPRATSANFIKSITATDDGLVDGVYQFHAVCDTDGWAGWQCKANKATAMANNWQITADTSTATCQPLLSIGDYKDVQNITNGAVTRNVGTVVLDGSETYSIISSRCTETYNVFATTLADKMSNKAENKPVICSHFQCAGNSQKQLNAIGQIAFNSLADYSRTCYLSVPTTVTNNAEMQAYMTELAPVILVYPLATPTTETVTGQTLTITQGTNVVTAEGSVSDLELEVSYKAYAEVTVEEIEAVNTDENVEVTIS